MISLRGSRARGGRGTRGSWGVLSLTLLLTACSVINDSTEVQCRTNDDCATRFSGVADVMAYSCVESFCVRPFCTTDAECRGRGDRYVGSVCGGDSLCASPATASCRTVEDCGGQSPTMQCIEGRCEDKVWGCRGELDNRPEAVERTATVQIRVYNLLTRMPVPSVSGRACNLPTFDPDCNQPLVSSGSYNPQDGTLTLAGLPQDTPIRVKLDFPGTDFIGIDHYATRTPRDVTHLGLVTTMPRSLVPMVTSVLDPPRVIDPALGSISVVVRDCAGQAASGVQVRMMEQDKVNGTEIIYFGSDGQPAPNASGTQAFGTALIINAKPGKILTLQSFLSGQMLNEYRAMAFPGRSTEISFFPRVYR